MSRWNRESIDPSLYTDAIGARELEANALKQALSYDAYGNQTEFDVVVLTRPIPMSALDAASVLTSNSNNADDVLSNDPTDGSIQFKGRIEGRGFISPHASLPNPCNLQFGTNPGTIIKVINMHTTFVSVVGYKGRIPQIGDRVKVKLATGDIKFNLQYAVFDQIMDSNNGSSVSNSLADQCTNLASKFNSFDPETNLGDITITMASNDDEGPGNRGMSRAEAQPIVDSIMSQLRTGGALGYTPLEDGQCGFPADFPGVSEELKTKYAVTRCQTATIGVTARGNAATVVGHPEFISSLQEMYAAATAQSWWSEATERGQIPICFSRGYRPIEDQVYLRIKNGGHRNFAQVMSSPTSPPCSPPTAKPGRSRHNLGLAIDFGGLIGQSRQNGDSDHLYPGIESEASRWLTSKGLDGDGTYSLKRYSAESWHWSVDGG